LKEFGELKALKWWPAWLEQEDGYKVGFESKSTDTCHGIVLHGESSNDIAGRTGVGGA